MRTREVEKNAVPPHDVAGAAGGDANEALFPAEAASRRFRHRAASQAKVPRRLTFLKKRFLKLSEEKKTPHGHQSLRSTPQRPHPEPPLPVANSLRAR